MPWQRWLRASRAYDVWRLYRARGQRREFNELLDRHLAWETVDTPYDQQLVRARLQGRAADRRPVWGEGQRPKVVAFGACEWEQYGLWPAFTAVADFEFFDYQAWLRARGLLLGDEAVAVPLADAFLDFVDRSSTERSPSLAFFYAAGLYVADRLLVELAARGIWTVIMSLDDKHQFVRPTDTRTGQAHQLRAARQCDLYWTTWKTGTHIVLSKGGTPWYAAEGAGPDFHRPVEVPRDLDVVFVGQAYGERKALVEYLRERGFGVTAVGSGWPDGFASFSATIELFSRARVVLGVGGVGHQAGVKHLKGRDFEVPMSGALYLTSFNPELADHFVIGKEILCYSSFEECADILHWVRRHPEEAARIRAAALARSRADHTWEARLRSCLSLFAGA
jgi:hypothetical protein